VTTAPAESQEVLKGCPSPVSIFQGAILIPTEPDAEITRAITNLVKIGCHPEVAAGAFAIPLSVFRRWERNGIEDIVAGRDTKAARLILGMTAAANQDEVRQVLLLQAGYNFEAVKFMLERRYSERWSPKAGATLRVGGIPDAPIEVQSTVVEREISADEAPALLATLEAIGYLGYLAEERKKETAGSKVVEIERAKPEPAPSTPEPEQRGYDPIAQILGRR
jgi:hypothetical protein